MNEELINSKYKQHVCKKNMRMVDFKYQIDGYECIYPERGMNAYQVELFLRTGTLVYKE